MSLYNLVAMSEFSVFGYNRIGHSPEKDPPFGATTCHHGMLLMVHTGRSKVV